MVAVLPIVRQLQVPRSRDGRSTGKVSSHTSPAQPGSTRIGFITASTGGFIDEFTAGRKFGPLGLPGVANEAVSPRWGCSDRLLVSGMTSGIRRWRAGRSWER